MKFNRDDLDIQAWYAIITDIDIEIEMQQERRERYIEIAQQYGYDYRDGRLIATDEQEATE